jgi:LEA14-like dessication related protein
MKNPVLSGVFILFGLLILTSGCMEPPIQEPTVSVSDIAFSDISFQTMKINTTVIIYNPNPVGARLNKVVFDIYYLDGTRNYLGHGEQSDIDVISNGNTTVTIPVTIGNIPALRATGLLIKEGSLTLNVNGSAFIDVKVTSFEKKFEQSKEIQVSDLKSLLPAASIPGTNINITDKLKQLGGYL